MNQLVPNNKFACNKKYGLQEYLTNTILFVLCEMCIYTKTLQRLLLHTLSFRYITQPTFYQLEKTLL